MHHFARRFLWLFCVLLAACTASLCQQEPSRGGEEAVVRRMVDGMMQPYMQRNRYPGAIVGVSLHGRRYFFTYGQATDDGAPFTPDTLVEIGSCTKVFTTTLFALAINRGQIEPNASAQKYMPGGFSLQRTARAVTPLELADFTSGMPDDPPNLPARLEMRSIEHYTTKDFLSWVSRWRPRTPLPAPYLYSNAGIGLLGYLVEIATREPWERQLNGDILEPLGMHDTALRPGPEQMRRMARGHKPNGQDAPPWPIYAWYAAGGLRSTARDMLSFGEANLGHAEVNGQAVPAALTAAMQLAQKPVYTMPNGIDKQAMAWSINMGGGEPGLRPVIMKNGGTDGFHSAITINHSKDAAVFVVFNDSGANATGLAIEISRHLP